jgi:hypothetical protein
MPLRVRKHSMLDIPSLAWKPPKSNNKVIIISDTALPCVPSSNPSWVSVLLKIWHSLALQVPTAEFGWCSGLYFKLEFQIFRRIVKAFFVLCPEQGSSTVFCLFVCF